MMRKTMRLSSAHQLQCREIWGGIGATDAELKVPGIEASVISRPAGGDTGGGDIHYVGLCGHGVLSRFVVADVSGHGQPASRLAGRLRELMAEHMNTPDQSELVRSLNDEFAAMAKCGSFATALMATYMSGEGHLIAVNAGHPRPLWHSRDAGAWRLLTHEVPESVGRLMNLPLGVIARTGYQQFAVPLAPGDMVVMYSDSLIEAEGPEGRQLGEAGLLSLAGRLDGDRPAVFGHELLSAVLEFRRGRPLEDDMTLLTLLHTADGQADQ